eukprot:1088205-Alexandrium_andersonii.AAC.1
MQFGRSGRPADQLPWYDQKFSATIAFRSVQEVRQEAWDGKCNDWPFFERDGYRLVFEPRPNGLSHIDEPGPPSWVRLEPVEKPGLDGELADELRSND